MSFDPQKMYVVLAADGTATPYRGGADFFDYRTLNLRWRARGGSSPNTSSMQTGQAGKCIHTVTNLSTCYPAKHNCTSRIPTACLSSL